MTTLRITLICLALALTAPSAAVAQGTGAAGYTVITMGQNQRDSDRPARPRASNTPPAVKTGLLVLAVALPLVMLVGLRRGPRRR